MRANTHRAKRIHVRKELHQNNNDKEIEMAKRINSVLKVTNL